MIGSAVRLVRSEMGIEGMELARLIGISQSYLSRIENNKRVPSVEVLGKIDLLAAERGVPSNLVGLSDVNDQTARSVNIFMARQDVSLLRKQSVRALIDLALRAE